MFPLIRYTPIDVCIQSCMEYKRYTLDIIQSFISLFSQSDFPTSVFVTAQFGHIVI